MVDHHPTVESKCRAQVCRPYPCLAHIPLHTVCASFEFGQLVLELLVQGFDLPDDTPPIGLQRLQLGADGP
eukprot:1203889-Pyramimonas_sp.AAC.1